MGLKKRVLQAILESDLTSLSESQRMTLRFLPSEDVSRTDPVAPGSLVSIRMRDQLSLVLIVPGSGGLVLRVEQGPLQVVSTESPLGVALMTHRVGETVELSTASGVTRQIELVDHW